MQSVRHPLGDAEVRSSNPAPAGSLYSFTNIGRAWRGERLLRNEMRGGGFRSPSSSNFKIEKMRGGLGLGLRQYMFAVVVRLRVAVVSLGLRHYGTR